MAESGEYGGVVPDDLEDLKNVDHAPSPQVGHLLTVTEVEPNGHVHWAAVAGSTGTFLDSQIPASIARDSEVTAAVSAHVAATDPHADRAYTDTKIAALVDSAPDLLNTLGEIATALQTDESGAAALATTVANKQPLDSDLTAIAALISAANKMPYATGAGAWALADLTAFARTLLDDPDAATALATLGIDRTGITDGQLLAWSSALSKFVPVNPTGNGELAYAENVSFTGTTIAGTSTANGTAVDIPGCSISVPVSARPVWIEAAFEWSQSVAGQGQVTLLIIETTSGSSTLVSTFRSLPNNTGPRSQNGHISRRIRIGATSGVRTFKVQARCDSTGATVPSISVLNQTTAPSYITALAG